jgi:hypothetical protein
VAQVADPSPMLSTRFLAFTLTLSLLAFLSLGCSGRAGTAQKLFDNGDYQKVIDKYPDLDVARRAHAKLAEELLQKKDYSAVIHNYSDTPAAYKARLELAQKLFDEGKYQALIDSFPQSPLVVTAKSKLADSLVAAGQLDKVMLWYPDTPQARQIKEDQAKTEFARIKKLPRKDKMLALEEFMKKYSGTEPFKEANEMLTKMREAANKQANKK